MKEKDSDNDNENQIVFSTNQRLSLEAPRIQKLTYEQTTNESNMVALIAR